eukprot:scaffold265135_cov31-Tisochrysis_lutea.AAC.1
MCRLAHADTRAQLRAPHIDSCRGAHLLPACRRHAPPGTALLGPLLSDTARRAPGVTALHLQTRAQAHQQSGTDRRSHWRGRLAVAPPPLRA